MSNYFKALPLSRIKIRKIAKKLREIIEIPNSKPFPVIEFLENILYEGFGYVYDICDISELKNEYAITIPKEKVIKIREDVYLNAINGIPRDLFTIAHELGHIILHNEERIEFARNEQGYKAYEDPEWQANTFAGELLAPADELKNMDEFDVIDRYNISWEAASIQLKEAKKI